MDIEFKLFGSLTIKQFTYVAVTCIVALFFYITPVLGVLRWPFVVVTLLFGLSLAFLKVNEQPFTVWFGHFINNLFTSQRKVYQKNAQTPQILSGRQVQELPQKTALTSGLSPEVTGVLRALQAEPDETASSVRPAAQVDVDDILADDRASELDRYFQTATDASLQKYGITPEVKTPAPVATTRAVNMANAGLEINPARRPGNAQTTAVPSKGKLIGIVQLPDGKPLAGVAVKLDAPAELPDYEFVSDAAGELRALEPLVDGSYVVRLQATAASFPEYQLQVKDGIVPVYRYLPRPIQP